MATEGFTIAQAAESMGVSTRTVRRFIKAGKIKAVLVAGQFGEEYRIADLPADLVRQNDTTRIASPVPGDNGHASVQTPGQSMDIIRELQDKNLALAAQLGAATERIRNLENQVKLLAAPKRPWWKRLFPWMG